MLNLFILFYLVQIKVKKLSVYFVLKLKNLVNKFFFEIICNILNEKII